MEVVTCPNCGEENPAKFRLCGYCGTALAPALPAQEVRKTVTIVFSDLKGSTNLGEALDPESLREVMTRYFDSMKAVLDLHGGTIEKYIGDAIMAVFGLPRLHEDDALRAVRAAYGMQQALADLNRELLATYGVELTNRTGVNTGEVVAGDPTTGQRLVTGDAVNTAARLEQAAPANEILIGGLTYALVRGQVEVEQVEPLELKGKAERVPAFRLVGLIGAGAATGPVESPLVGRDAELAILEEALADAYVTQRTRLVTVVGEPGVGKSRLIREFLDEHEGDARTLVGRCLSYGQGITFWPVAEVVRMAAGIEEEDTPELAHERIRDLLDPDDPDRDNIAERVAAAIGLNAAQLPVTEIFWGIRKLFEALAEEQPLIILWDDIHSAAPTFLELIEHLLESSRRVPIVLVCSARHELLETHPEWAERPDAATIVLQPLTAADAEVFVDRLVGDLDLPVDVRRRVVRAAEGNPLYVEQMVSMLTDQIQAGGVGGDGAVTPGALSEFIVPPSIQALIAARLDLLSREERAVVEPAAVIGLVFPEPAVQELVPDPVRPNLTQHMQMLGRKQLVRPADDSSGGGDDSDTYRFHHILIRDTAYNALLKRARATLHERFVAWAEQVNRERDREQEFEEILGYHLEQAYRYRTELGPLDDEGRSIGLRASTRLGTAGRRAYARGDLPAAVNLLSRAAALREADDRDRIELLCDLGEAQLERGTLGEATITLDEAAAAAERIGDIRLAARAVITRVAVDFYEGAPGSGAKALETAERSIATFQAAGDRAGLAWAWRLAGIVHGTDGGYDKAAEAAEHMIEHATAAGDKRMAARGAAGFASVALRGSLAVSDMIERCERLTAQVEDDRRSHAVVAGVLAQLYAMRGEFDRARELCETQRQMLAELGPSVTALSTSIERARVELLAGDLEAAERELRSDDVALEALGERYYRSTIVGMLAWVLALDGRAEEGEAAVETARDLTDEDDVLSMVLWRTARARLLADAGRADEALVEAEAAVTIATDSADIDLLGDAKAELGETLYRARRIDEAGPPWREALALYERKENLVSASRVRARLEATATA